MKIKILNARRYIFNGEAKEVVLPGEDGELSVLDFHQPCIARLKAGRIKVRSGNVKQGTQRQEDFVIARGVARVGIHGLSILIEEPGKKKA